MAKLELEHTEIKSTCNVKYANYFEERISELHIKLEECRDETESAMIRGRIRELRDVLSIQPEVKQSKLIPGFKPLSVS